MLSSLKDDVRYAIPTPQSSAFMKRSTEESEKLMVQDLAASGLSPELMRCHTSDIFPANCPKGVTAGYYIPYFNLDGRGIIRSSSGLEMYRW